MFAPTTKTSSVTNTKLSIAIVFLGTSIMLAASLGAVEKSVGSRTQTSAPALVSRAVFAGESIEGDSAPYRITTISAPLRELLIPMKRDEKIHVMIILKDQADLRGIRGNYREVRERLDKTASRRESDTAIDSIRATVEKLQKNGHVDTVQKYWLVNAYSLNANYRSVLELALNKDVAVVDIFPIVEYQQDTTTDLSSSPNNSVPELESAYYGPTYIKAPEAWSMGYRGEGVTVGIIDTGVYENHPALTGKIATIQSGPNQGKKAFFDGNSIVEPYELKTNSHGTHVTGIVVGGHAVGGESTIDSSKFIGVAPEAKYVFGRSGLNTPGSLQWMSDPDQNPDTPDYPIVVNNSWINSLSTSLTYWIDNLEALGITVVFSAGNSGAAGEQSIKGLHKYPSLLLVANTSEDNLVNPGSSKGTIFYYGEEYMKPDVSAPGTKILSAVYPGSYTGQEPNINVPGIYKNLNGTSMSAPMVTGAIALIQQAYYQKNNSYLSPQKIKSILQLTASNIGNDTGKDMETGSGLVDVVSAIDLSLNHATFKGVVKNTVNMPIAFARISFVHNSLWYEFVTEKDGSFEFALPEGDVNFEFKKQNHQDASIQLNGLKVGASVEKEVVLVSPSATLAFTPKTLNFFSTINSQAVLPIEISNHGYENLKIDEIKSTNPHFFVTNEFPLYVAPYSAVELLVSYSPASVVEEQGSLSFVSNAGNDPGNIEVVGIGNDALFSDVAVNLKIAGNPFVGTLGYGMGSQWGDYNDDGWQDMMLGNNGVTENPLGFAAVNIQGNKFVIKESYDGLADYMFGSQKTYVRGIYFADIDNDGDQDIVAIFSNSIVIIENNGQGAFISKYVIDSNFNSYDGLSIFDFDHDGKLDIVSINSVSSLQKGFSEEIILYRQTGSPFLFNKSYLTEDIVFKISHSGCLSFDYNNDSWVDLFCGSFVTLKMEVPTTPLIYFLFKNINGSKLELVQQFGPYYYTDAAVRDYDNDGDMDIYIQVREPDSENGFANDYILKNEFQNNSQPYVLVDSPYISKTETHFGAGPVTWTDYDNDGNADIFFTYDQKGYNRLFRDIGDHVQYEDRAALEGIQGEFETNSISTERGATWVDYDNDGDLDVYVTRKKWFNSLYKNNYLEKIGTNNWLELQLIGSTSNRDAIGARVELQFTDGKKISDQILVTHQTDGQDPRIIHFGLGTKTVTDIEGMNIYWPNGEMQNVVIKEINKKIIIKEVNVDDLDSDMVENSVDNCILVANTNQSDYDSDRKGDLCDLPLGDTNQDQTLNVADVQCITLISLWILQNKVEPIPACLVSRDLRDADLNCDGTVNVVDLQAMELLALNLTCDTETGHCNSVYDEKIDNNKNNIQDSCEK